MNQGKIYIGTSGWVYEHWDGLFYPTGLSSEGKFAYYQEFFNTVEVNYSFYRLPSEKAIAHWKEITPPDFVFSLKASRNITHRGKLEKSGYFLRMFLNRVKPLGEKLGPILFQFPPNFKKDKDRLINFLNLLPSGLRTTIEFRNDSWNNPEIFDLLKEKMVAYCIISAPQLETRLEITALFVYIRLHGAKAWYASCYTDSELKWWAKKIKEILSDGLDVYIYFNNDFRAYAVKNALKLKEIMKTTETPCKTG
ncbi:MAG: DUF72 domain-containing protein [Candidatus Edwardsbacteria bacterium]